MFLWCERFDTDEAAALPGLPADGRAVADEAAVALEDGAGVAEAAGVAIFGGELVFLGDGIFLGELVFFEVRPSSPLHFSEEPASVPLGVYLLSSVEDDEVDIIRFLDGDFVGGVAAAVEVLAATFSDGNWSTRLSISLAFFISFMLLRSSCASSFPWYTALTSLGILSKRQKYECVMCCIAERAIFSAVSR